MRDLLFNVLRRAKVGGVSQEEPVSIDMAFVDLFG